MICLPVVVLKVIQHYHSTIVNCMCTDPKLPGVNMLAITIGKKRVGKNSEFFSVHLLTEPGRFSII